MKKLYQYPLSCIIQILLCKIGIACHNPFRDECTMDFECCSPSKGKSKYWLRISANKLPFRIAVSYIPTKPVGETGRTFIKRKHYVFFNRTIFKRDKKI